MLQQPSLPDCPGVYLFMNAAGEALYIGKARSLKQRVASYFVADNQMDRKRQALLEDADHIEHIVTHSEEDALLLEEYLVKRYQPPFNALLKGGQPFLYMVFADNPPALKLLREKPTAEIVVGPFIHKQVARKLYDYLLRTFQLYRCHQKNAHGCLKFHLGICAGTCTGSYDETAYRKRLELAHQALNNDQDTFVHTIAGAEDAARARLDFEAARQLHGYAVNAAEILATIARTGSVGTYEREVRAHEAHHVVARTHAMRAQNEAALTELQQLLGLATPPKTIDCFDISHHQSQYIVGSVVRFRDGLPDRAAFRRFRIRSIEVQNDYAALQEIVRRRYANSHDLPDAMLIDGGKGQRSMAAEVAPAHIPVASISKQEERLHTPRNPDGIVLDPATPLGALMIALRDYAHHVAISYHQLLSRKQYRSDRPRRSSS